MKLASLPLDLDNIRLDGGTQVREGLDEAWVAELTELYREGHEIDPVLVVVETRGGEEINWLADGFHRVEAKRRSGSMTIMATRRTGSAATLDMAKMLASAANKNGRPLLPGDKRRAVLMARSTPEGAAMGVRELARHCGVAMSYASEIMGGCSAPNTSQCSDRRSAASAMVQAKIHGDLRRRVDEAVLAAPKRPSTEIAAAVGCGVQTVRERRAALGLSLSKAEAARARPVPARDAAEVLLREHPDWTNAKVAEESGAGHETVSKLRSKLGIAPRRGAPTAGVGPAPSAPARKGGDVRDGAEVIRARPPEPPASGPRLPSYSTPRIAAAADAFLEAGATAADLALLTDRFNAGRGAAAR